ncbi:MAG: glycosyltransferase family 2 protein [Bacteroidota bacterium]
MKVSVIIPVYNASQFLEKSVLSALEQPETGEVILVDDKSQDNSAEISRELEARFENVRFFTHADNKNHGANITRNRGIEFAAFPFISFLDADDFYLPGRFSETKKVFDNFPDAEGVYEAIGTFSYDEQSMQKHVERMKSATASGTNLMLTTMTYALKPSELFEKLFEGAHGWIHLDGFTVTKKALERVGAFDVDLRWNEDNEFFYRLSYQCKLYPGTLDKAVSMRGVHKDNFTLSSEGTEITRFYNVIMFRKLFHFMLKNSMSKNVSRIILFRYLDFYTHRFIKHPITFKRKVIKAFNLIITLFRYPITIIKII